MFWSFSGPFPDDGQNMREVDFRGKLEQSVFVGFGNIDFM
jgi:hypothetical protein